MESDKDFDKNVFQFTHLILSLSTSCMIQLGKSPNPMTNKMERDLGQAEATISILEMLKEKTKGNLSKDEQMILDTSLTNLRLNFVKEIEKEEKEESTAKKDEVKAEDKKTPSE
ncbi:DUF1844 domain-containing protein [bacterium]|nr:DUF1844 domain-containing protein [bacterium]